MIEKSSAHEEVTYPVVAANGRVAVVTGMRAAAHTIVTYAEDVKAMPGYAQAGSRAGN